jgi:ketosteroid isomerase-like protein
MLRTLLLLAVLALSPPAWCAEESAGPAASVRAFTAAINDRDLDALLVQLLDGGVHFNFRPSHQGQGATEITSELIPRWSMVAPVLFSTTESYRRELEVLDTMVQGDIATVWASVKTETVMRGSGKANSSAFTEVYLMVATSDGWKIAGVADNRQPNDVGMGGD